MGTGIAGENGVPDGSRSVPTTGMRGGLGRTLLTAFLILTILPLALTVGYAAQQNRQNLQREVESKLLAVAALKGEELEQWFGDLRNLLLLSVSLNDGVSEHALSSWWRSLTYQFPDLIGAVVQGSDQQLIWKSGACQEILASSELSALSVGEYLPAAKFELSSPAGVIVLPIAYQDRMYTFCFSGAILEQVIRHEAMIDPPGEVYIVYQSCIWPSGDRVCSEAALQDLARVRPGSDVYINHQGISVIGAYYPLAELGIGILVEQEQVQMLESTDRIAATLIALVLAVALVTTTIAAVVIRQITRPVIRLTESALAMAEGDLDQHLTVTSRDEIGILTYVFNEMAAELKSLYEDLEAKVTERTKKLQQANYQIQRRALHLQASQEISQAITSVRDPEHLLNRVTDLIRDSFMYASVAVYMVEPGGGAVRLKATSPEVRHVQDDDHVEPGDWPVYLYAGEGTVVERAIRKRESQVYSQQTSEAVEWYRRTLSRVAVPLRMEDRVMGAIAALSTEREGVQEDEIDVLELLANQIAIAIENARAYERERLAAQHLEEAEAFKARFLSNMSHALREPLNTIIGFSRLMIKGIDGPLTKQQLLDMEQIYNDSQRLLFLINDVLSISQIQAGLMELKLQPVQLHEVVSGVLPTAEALVRGKDIELVQQIPEDLPLLRVDPTRIRQVLVHLFNNAAKFTERGRITLRAWHSEDQVYVSVSDTGVGIPPEDLDRIFVHFERGSTRKGSQHGVGLGLALSKEFVELHGGRIWAQSKVGEGSTFTFSLPCYGILGQSEGGLN